MEKCSGEVKTLGFVRIGIGLFFLMFGLMKAFIMGPEMVTGMMAGLFGVEGFIASALAWITIIVEIVGGLIVLAGNNVPNMFYKGSLLAFATVTIVGYTVAFVLNDKVTMDIVMKQMLWHGQLLFVIVGLLFSNPKCPLGLTGENK